MRLNTLDTSQAAASRDAPSVLTDAIRFPSEGRLAEGPTDGYFQYPAQLKLHQIDFINIDRLAQTEDRNNDPQADRNLGGSHRQREDDIHLPVNLPEVP